MENFYEKINEECGVRLPFSNEQDWEICAGDPNHTSGYIAFYNKYSDDMDIWQKYLAANLIVQGIEDLMEQNEDQNVIDALWSETQKILLKDNHRHTIFSWSCVEQEPEDSWLITPRMRELL
ncbi:hypothetical protein [Ruminococcus flavefaciens]|uniref:hypothetical protein n=1 Tax=Ruminococcus flavefaciens TaxID=1265 RepID=UPI0002D37555|nr:hypothetical protein [Ruminococcus flavefaciens]